MLLFVSIGSNKTKPTWCPKGRRTKSNVWGSWCLCELFNFLRQVALLCYEWPLYEYWFTSACSVLFVLCSIFTQGLSCGLRTMIHFIVFACTSAPDLSSVHLPVARCLTLLLSRVIRRLTSHSLKNLAFHSLLRWKMITLHSFSWPRSSFIWQPT